MKYTDPTMTALEAVKKTTKKGGEYWMAKDIQPILGYSTWESFRGGAVARAMESCKSAGSDPSHHFRDITKVMEVGNGARVDVADCYLDRYACYLVAMNGDAGKAEISAAQRYFTVQTRLQEVEKLELENAERLRLRDRVTVATKHLNSAAKAAGVQNYAFFANAGYQGLYKMGLADIKKKKGIPDKEQLFDRAGRLELAANEFRATLAEKAIVEKKIKGQTALENEHRRVGGAVRQTMLNESGVTPEGLPAEPSIKQLGASAKKQVKAGKDPAPPPDLI